MSKEKAKDKGGTLAGKSKDFNNKRGANGKVMNADHTTNEIMNETGNRRV